jgi:hypothetical protein
VSELEFFTFLVHFKDLKNFSKSSETFFNSSSFEAFVETSFTHKAHPEPGGQFD